MPENDLPAILSRVIETKAEYDIRLLAQTITRNETLDMYWLRGERQSPATFCPNVRVLKNYEALDYLESQAGRVAFKLPDPDITLERELVAVSHLIREVGEALESVAETLADGVVEESELRITIPKLEAVIQECASLKYLLEDLCKKKKKKTKR